MFSFLCSYHSAVPELINTLSYTLDLVLMSLDTFLILFTELVDLFRSVFFHDETTLIIAPALLYPLALLVRYTSAPGISIKNRVI